MLGCVCSRDGSCQTGGQRGSFACATCAHVPAGPTGAPSLPCTDAHPAYAYASSRQVGHPVALSFECAHTPGQLRPLFRLCRFGVGPLHFMSVDLWVWGYLRYMGCSYILPRSSSPLTPFFCIAFRVSSSFLCACPLFVVGIRRCAVNSSLRLLFAVGVRRRVAPSFRLRFLFLAFLVYRFFSSRSLFFVAFVMMLLLVSPSLCGV